MKALLKVAIVVSICIGISASSVKPAQAFACGTCGNCLGGHTNPFGGGESEGIHSDCVAVAGCPHPGCVKTFQPTSSDVERMLVKVEGGDIKAAQTLLRKYPGVVVWNRERHALQLSAPCTGEGFIAHIPLTARQSQALEGE
jgi:hypothetical protein